MAPEGMAPPDYPVNLILAGRRCLVVGGGTAGWWVKAVQLDLEAKGIIRRAPKSPVRLYRPSA